VLTTRRFHVRLSAQKLRLLVQIYTWWSRSSISNASIFYLLYT